MTYIEVSRIQSKATKIAEDLATVLSDSPHLYRKTKQQYKDLAICLLNSVNTISDILQVDSLSHIDDKSDEFSSVRFETADLDSAMSQTIKQVNMLSNFVCTGRDDSVNANISTLKMYGTILEQASLHDFGYTEVNTCARILNKWFKIRFSENATDFVYNIAYLPSWITYMITCYGKYVELQEEASFISLLDKWFDSLHSEKSSKWAVPYQVHMIGKSANPADYTVTAVVIGDILMDEVLYQLTESSSPQLVSNLSCYPVASIVKLANPSLLPVIRSRLINREKLAKKYLTTSERS